MVQRVEGNGGGLFRRLLTRVGGWDAARHRGARAEAGVIAIASGKGGTGKSFFATSLAIELSRRMRVVLVDCDYGLGSDHLLLGTHPVATLRDVVAGRVRPQDALVATAHGPLLLPGGSGMSSMVELSDGELIALASALGDVARHTDQLVLDLGAGISPQVVLTLLTAQQVVLVTNPDIAALTDAYALVKCLARQVVRPAVGVVVNRVPQPGAAEASCRAAPCGEGTARASTADPRFEGASAPAVLEPPAPTPAAMGEQTFGKLADVARRFCSYPLHYLGSVPDDPVVTQRRLGQAPLVASHPQCAVALAIAAIARRLETLAGGVGPRPSTPADDLTARWRRLIPHRRSRA